MTRYALIDRMLSSRNQTYSIQDITDVLAERLPEFGQKGVSKRCVEKDLNYLEFGSPFDVDIEEYWIDASDKNDRPYRKRCIRYADPTFSIFKPKLTEDEKSVLATALDTLGGFDGLENFEWLNDLKTRLELEERAPIISMSKNLLQNSTLIARLFTTIRLKQVITLNYHLFKNQRDTIVDLCPLLLKEYNNRWFLIASACDTGSVLTFALDRINDFVVNHKKTYRENIHNIEEMYEDIIGVTYKEEAPVEEIIFWVSDVSKDYMLTKPIHGSQTRLHGQREELMRVDNQNLKGGIYLKIRCKENYELIRELCSFGPELMVISPPRIVNQVKDRLKAMNELYGIKRQS